MVKKTYNVVVTFTPSDLEIIKKHLSDNELPFEEDNILDFMHDTILARVENLFSQQLRDSRENLLKLIGEIKEVIRDSGNQNIRHEKGE